MSVMEQLRAMKERNALLLQEHDTLHAEKPVKLREKLVAMAVTGKPHVYADVVRICNLPIVEPFTPEQVEEFSKQNILREKYADGFRFFQPQAEAIATFDRYGCLFAAIGVGFGKTMVTISIADRAHRKGIRKIMLCVPSQVYGQLWKRDIQWIRNRIPIQVPIHGLGGLTQAKRSNLVNSGMHGLYIVPYSLLSTKDTDLLLKAINPQLAIFDEGHNLKNRKAARTKRVMAFIDKQENISISVLSGTVTSKSVMDYHHLIRATLHNNCPLPLPVNLAQEWGQLLDSNNFASTAIAAPIMPLVDWAYKNFPDFKEAGRAAFRAAYRRRLITTPGVVATSDNEIGTSLIIANASVMDNGHDGGFDKKREAAFEKAHPKLSALIEQVDSQWETPNGDPIEYAIHKYKWLSELTVGFWNKLVWPEPEDYARKKNISVNEACEQIVRAQDHHTQHNAYLCVLREWLKKSHKSGLDTPMLVGASMAREGSTRVTKELYQAWKLAKDLEWKGMPERDSIPVRVDPYKIDHVVEWAKEMHAEGHGGLVWFWHNEIGIWIMEALKAAGLPTVRAFAGDNDKILEASSAKSFCVASIAAHGTGKNLQHFQHQVFVQWPRAALVAEQAIGRTHRNGQEADELVVWTINTTMFDFLNFAATINDACYIQQTTSVRQKVIYASYDPMPIIYPSEALIERGFQAQRLSREMQAMMKERFAAE